MDTSRTRLNDNRSFSNVERARTPNARRRLCFAHHRLANASFPPARRRTLPIWIISVPLKTSFLLFAMIRRFRWDCCPVIWCNHLADRNDRVINDDEREMKETDESRCCSLDWSISCNWTRNHLALISFSFMPTGDDRCHAVPDNNRSDLFSFC